MGTDSNNGRLEEECYLLGFRPSKKKLTESSYSTTQDVVDSIQGKEVAALLKMPTPKLLGDWDTSAGEEGTPEVTKKYLAMTPGQFSEQLNTIIINRLQEHITMDTNYTVDDGAKLKSFEEFPVGRTDLDDVTLKATTPGIVTLDFHGNKINDGLKGTNTEPASGASTLDMTTEKERALKRMAQFISNYKNNHNELYTKVGY